ncbi:hypothetical protein KJ359_002284 [Pestalotiopsis sp. 9143b]|nr:hypothetical protein KJ359_002284 [Pestalotiopsis sp. 9143b]
MVRGDPPVEPSDLAGPRQVTYAPTPVRGHIPAPAARAAAEKALSCFNVDKTSDTELFKEIEERLLLAMSCSHLSLHDFTYLMISWGCDPALARTWLRDADYRGENFCVSACTWLLTAAYPLGPEEALSYQSSSRDIQKEKSLHRNWQKNRTRIAVDQRHATRRALLPPVDPGLALAWRKMALWRAQKLGWADVRHERGLLLGPLLDAAARITLLEFGLDPNKGEFNGALLRQLKSIDTKDWNDFMEVSL